MGPDSKYLVIGTKILVMVCGLVVITSCAVGFFTYWRFKQALVARELNELSTLSRVASARFLAGVSNVRADAEVLSGLPAVQGFVRATFAGGVDPFDGSTEKQLRTRIAIIFESLLRSKPDYVQARLIGVADGGREMIRVDRLGEEGDIRLVPDSQLLRKGDRTYFQEAVKTPRGQVYLSEVELNREHDNRLTMPHLPVIRAAMPLYTPQGEVFGIVVVNRSLSPVFEELRRNIQSEQSLYITNDQGDFLRHPDPTKAFGFELGRRHRLQEEFPRLQHVVSDKGENARPVIEHTNAGVPLALGWNRVSFDPDRPDRFFTFALAVPYEIVSAEPIRARNVSILVAFAVLVPALAIGYAHSRTLANPLQQIAAAAKAFGRDESEIDLPLDANDETGIVARALQSMIDQVRSRTDALEAEIVERKRAEQVGREQAARIYAIVNSVVDAIITISPDGRVESLNPAAERMFGYSANEVIGQNVKMLMPEPFRGEHDQYLRNYMETGIPKIIGKGREVIGVRKNGISFPIDLAVSDVQLGDRRMFTGVVRDMTERKRAEQLLVEQSARIQAIVNSVIDAIITIRPDGTVESLNPAAERMFGYSADEVLGQNVKMLMPEPFRGEHDQYLRNYLETGVPKIIGTGREVIGVRKDGTQFPIDLAVSQVQLGDRRMFTGVVRDISARKRSESDLVQANHELARRAAAIERFNKQLSRSNDELKQFAYVASHDLQEPLRKVTSFCEMLRDEYGDKLDAEAQTYIDYAVGGALRMKALVSDLLDYSRVETQGRPLTPTPAENALAEAIDNLEMTIAEAGATVEGTPLPVVAADRAQLVRLFQNLIANAIKYRSDAPPRVNVWAAEQDDEWVFHVQDNGLGIDPQYHARIFVIFQRLHSREAYAGTGIGLAVCKRIVERFGGRIWVESTLGEGSDFCIALPKVEAAVNDSPKQGQENELDTDRLVLQAD
ncbi:MAG: PAS domain S-box protein [Pirellulales bacterium]